MMYQYHADEDSEECHHANILPHVVVMLKFNIEEICHIPVIFVLRTTVGILTI